MHIKKIELIGVCLVALFALFFYSYKLTSNPPGLYVDEATSAYNAYSIFKTGRDEYGKLFPFAFRLLGSYTPPLFIYLSAPIVGLLGLSVFSARLLSVISATIAIVIFYLILKELSFIKHRYTAIVATIFFAITPWLFFFGRIGYEQCLAFMFFCIYFYLTLRSLKSPRLWPLTLTTLSLATYADYPGRFLAPLFVCGVVLLFRKEIKIAHTWKYLRWGVLIAALVQIPNIYMLTTPSFFTKNSLFYSSTIIEQAKKLEVIFPHFVAIILAFAREFLSKYFTYFSPRSLFFLPDPDPQRSIPGLSVFYPWMVIPYIIGMYCLWKERNHVGARLVLFSLLVIPLPSALTPDPFHVQRTLPLLLPMSIVIAFGINTIFNHSRKNIMVIISLGLFLYSIFMLKNSYFTLLPQDRATVWGFQFAPLSEFIKKNPNVPVVIDQTTRTKPQNLAYIQLAFYLKIDPTVIQKSADTNISQHYYENPPFSFYRSFSNIEARPLEWGESVWRKAIFVGDTVSISDLEISLHNLTPLLSIQDPKGETVIRAFGTNPSR